MKKFYLILLVLILGVALSLAVPFYIGKGFAQFKALKVIPLWVDGVLAGFVLISWVFNAARVRLLVRAMGRRIGFIDSISIVISAEFAGNATPWGIGMPAAYTFLLGKKALSLAESMALVSLIVLFDLAVYVFASPVAAGALLLGKGPQTSMRLIVAVLIVVGATLIFVTIAFFFNRCIYYGVSRLIARLPWLSKYRFRFARKWVEFLRAMRILRRMSWGQRIGITFYTALYWLPRYSILVFVIFFLGKSVPLAYLFMVQALLNLGALIIFTPGGAGGVGLGYDALMSPYLTQSQIAFSLLVYRATTFYWYLVAGAPFFLYKSGQAAHYLLSGKQPPLKRKK
ncbi:MAG: lysylphosphatidylglycerol synthase transmembrane domain-containing protein [Desulfobacterales bacterium]|jgi:uncharacterized protein (TIRG00374 family)